MSFNPSLLLEEVCKVLRQRGVPSHDAKTTGDVLLEAELEGLSSHGLSRLPIYLAQLDAGGLNPNPRLSVERPAAAVAVVDGDLALGPVAGMKAVRRLAGLTCEAGTGCAVVRRAGHVGPLSYYVKRLSADGFVALAMANTPPAMAPWGGNRAILGTNPIAFSTPGDGDSWIADLALSVTARGKILQAARTGESIPAEWAVDSQGQSTRDPNAALQGAVMPAGGAKGYALALMVEVLAGILGGGILSAQLPLPWKQPALPSLSGFFLQAWNPSIFGQVEPLLNQLTEMIRAAGGRLPGERRREHQLRVQVEGIVLSAQVQKDLIQAGLALERCRM